MFEVGYLWVCGTAFRSPQTLPRPDLHLSCASAQNKRSWCCVYENLKGRRGRREVCLWQAPRVHAVASRHPQLLVQLLRRWHSWQELQIMRQLVDANEESKNCRENWFEGMGVLYPLIEVAWEGGRDSSGLDMLQQCTVYIYMYMLFDSYAFNAKQTRRK